MNPVGFNCGRFFEIESELQVGYSKKQNQCLEYGYHFEKFLAVMMGIFINTKILPTLYIDLNVVIPVVE